MKVAAWCPAILALGVLLGRAEEKPATSSVPNTPPPFLSAEGRERFLSAPSRRAPAPAVTAPTNVAAEKPAKSPARAEILTAIRRAYPYVPPAPSSEATADATSSASDVVTMKPFRVTATFEGLERAVTEKERKANEEAFNFKDGGTIMKFTERLELKLKYDPRHGGWDIINFRW